jgi:hypothetical protein
LLLLASNGPYADPLVADDAVEEQTFSLFGTVDEPFYHGATTLPDIHLVQCINLYWIMMLMTYYVVT